MAYDARRTTTPTPWHRQPEVLGGLRHAGAGLLAAAQPGAFGQRPSIMAQTMAGLPGVMQQAGQYAKTQELHAMKMAAAERAEAVAKARQRLFANAPPGQKDLFAAYGPEFVESALENQFDLSQSIPHQAHLAAAKTRAQPFTLAPGSQRFSGQVPTAEPQRFNWLFGDSMPQIPSTQVAPTVSTADAVKPIATSTVTPSPLVKLSQTGETESEKRIGGGSGDFFVALQTAASGAHAGSLRLNRARQLLANVETGTMSPVFAAVKGVLRQIHPNIEKFGFTDDVPYSDALQAVTSDMALDQISRTKGPISDKEMDTFQAMVVNLGHSPEGNMLILEMMEEVNDRSIVVARMAREYRAENEGMFDWDFFDKLDKYHKQNPFFTEVLNKRINKIMDAPTVEEKKMIGGKQYIKRAGKWYEWTD